ncbi:aminoglycoside phosphotransferase family protein [Saccharopolyspora elongata]|uniref:Aminoglycoside phosphotransferase domain-containing protein n=1 Tax=Saccharopolyspora elongata TaxID=2530387 RepID=A0A4V2YM13_9PSEU|nr:hypothetical protein [Saccharopolyspora elongata]TDD48767.1 hypothetical protein E1288_21095 [Saccharopolyspora elongata]
MTRRDWSELPAAVRAAIENQCGSVTRAVLPDAGRNSDVSATLHTGGGHVLFCKGVRLDTPQARMHRHEAQVNPYLPLGVAPRLLWESEVDGWLLLGFEHVPGHHADLSPGSPDLPLVADTLHTIGGALTPSPIYAPRLAEQWARLAAWRRLAHDQDAEADEWVRDRLDEFVDREHRAFTAIDGDALAHTDLHPLNVLVSERARVVDWAWSRRAAPWVDAGLLVLRLIGAGHTPPAAERWADDVVPAWSSVGEQLRTDFAVAVLGVWHHMARVSPGPQRAPLVGVARRWVAHRLGDAAPLISVQQ